MRTGNLIAESRLLIHMLACQFPVHCNCSIPHNLPSTLVLDIWKVLEEEMSAEGGLDGQWRSVPPLPTAQIFIVISHVNVPTNRPRSWDVSWAEDTAVAKQILYCAPGTP